jgi:hypothetical protein
VDDRGAVLVSAYGPDFMQVTTVSTSHDGEHPVSGTREFGIRELPDGSFIIYTRGADAPTGYLDLIGGKVGLVFGSADALWQSLQEKWVAFIEGNGGHAELGPTITQRTPLHEILNGSSDTLTFPHLLDIISHPNADSILQDLTTDSGPGNAPDADPSPPGSPNADSEGNFDMGVPLGVSEASFTENGAPGDEASPALDPKQIQDPLYADDANLPGETFDPGIEMNPGDVPLEGAVVDGLYSPIEADGLIAPAAIDVNNFGVDLSGADLAQAPSLNLDPQFFDAGGNGVDLGGVHPDHPAGGNDANFVNDPAAGDFGLQNPWNDAGLDGQVWAPQGPEY